MEKCVYCNRKCEEMSFMDPIGFFCKECKWSKVCSYGHEIEEQECPDCESLFRVCYKPGCMKNTVSDSSYGNLSYLPWCPYCGWSP